MCANYPVELHAFRCIPSNTPYEDSNELKAASQYTNFDDVNESHPLAIAFYKMLIMRYDN
jgi:hypothetical protein